MITHWMRALNKISDVDEVYVIVNDYNRSMFEAWARDFPQVKIASDGSTSNEVCRRQPTHWICHNVFVLDGCPDNIFCMCKLNVMCY